MLEGRPVADAIWRDVEQRAAGFSDRVGRKPCLAVVGGADNQAAMAYGRQIERQFSRHGVTVVPRTTSAGEMLKVVSRFSGDAEVDGILLLTPLPDGVGAEIAVQTIDPMKDVDGQHPANLGRLAQRRAAFAPATAMGGLRVLQHYGASVRGARVTVVGRSPVVGLPLALLLIAADATVTVCHTRSLDLPGLTRQADILCVAVGRAGLIGPEHVKPGALVLDFGAHPGADGGMRGDVQTEAVREIAGAITPVPGGTGPTTVAVLAQQTVQAAELRRA